MVRNQILIIVPHGICGGDVSNHGCDFAALSCAEKLVDVLHEHVKEHIVTIIVPGQSEMRFDCRRGRFRPDGGYEGCDLNRFQSRKGNPLVYRQRIKSFLDMNKDELLVVLDIHSFPEEDLYGVVDGNVAHITLLDDEQHKSSDRGFEIYSRELRDMLVERNIGVNLFQGIKNDIMDECKNDYKLPAILLEFNEMFIISNSRRLNPYWIGLLEVIMITIGDWILRGNIREEGEGNV